MGKTDSQILEAARRGDRLAMGRLLMEHDVRLRRKVAGWITPQLRPLLGVEDVLQETYAQAYDHIQSFKEQEGSFYPWLLKIAERRFFNARRRLLAAKRGLDKQVKAPARQASSLVDLVQRVGGDVSTPSRKAVRLENQRQVQIALAGLKDDYRQALWMRYIEGRPVREIAAQMGRSERAVQMLCNRGLKALREQMGNTSQYLSSRR